MHFTQRPVPVRRYRQRGLGADWGAIVGNIIGGATQIYGSREAKKVAQIQAQIGREAAASQKELLELEAQLIERKAELARQQAGATGPSFSPWMLAIPAGFLAIRLLTR